MHEFDITEGRGTIAYARTESRSTLPQCDAHGRLDPLDPDALDITLNGVTWALRPGVKAFTCRECVDVHLRPNDAVTADEALLSDAMADAWGDDYRPGLMDKRIFEVVDVDLDAATPLYCPLCSADIDTSTDVVECPVHGPLNLTVNRPKEAPA